MFNVLLVGQTASTLPDNGCEDFRLTRCDLLEDGLQRLKSEAFDAVVLNGSSIRESTISELKRLRAATSKFIAVVIDAPLFTASIKELSESGANEVVPGPMNGIATVALLVRLQNTSRIVAENQYHRRNSLSAMEELIGRSEAWQALRTYQETLVGGLDHVLILGEPDTGRYALARAIHRRSSVSTGPFIQVSCGTLPECMLEVEIFGNHKRMGGLGLARGGTLVISNAEQLSTALQEKLSQAFTAPSGKLPRVICLSTNKDSIQPGLMRHLKTMSVPALRERGGDILLIAEYFLRQLQDPNVKAPRYFDVDAKEAILQYRWPGNVRELQNAIERALLTSETPALSAADLGLAPKSHTLGKNDFTCETHAIDKEKEKISFAVKNDEKVLCDTKGEEKVSFAVGQPLHEVEREMLLRTLKMTEGNRTRAASILGISVRTLYSKLLEIEQYRKLTAKKEAAPEPAKRVSA